MLLVGCEKQPETIENEQMEQVEIDKTENIKKEADTDGCASLHWLRFLYGSPQSMSVRRWRTTTKRS